MKVRTLGTFKKPAQSRACKLNSGGDAYIAALQTVPYGEVVTFQELALMVKGFTTMGAMIQAGRAVRKIPTAVRTTAWWRVISSGKRSIRAATQLHRSVEQCRLLIEEGVAVDNVYRRHLTKPPGFLQPALRQHVLTPKAKHQYTLVWLHGRGFTGHHYVRQCHFFGCPKQAGLRVVLPTARCDGLPTEWFHGWPPGEDDLCSPRNHVLAVVREELKRLNGRGDRLFLGGSSQGCILGLDCYLRCRSQLGGFCGVVGWWPASSDGVLRSLGAERMRRPIRLFNGSEDTVVPWSKAKASFDKLQHAGLDNVRVHVERVGHRVGEREGHWIQSFLHEVLD